MPNLTLTEVDLAIPEFWANLALGSLSANTVMSKLVNRDFDSAVATKGDIVNIIKRGALVVNDKAVNTPINLQNPTNTKIPVELNKHKEVSWLIEDSASAKAIDAAIAYVQDAAIALAEDFDSSLTALYTELAESTGTAGVDLTVPTIIAARKRLNDLKCPVRGRNLIISSKDEAALLNLEQFTRANWDVQNSEALREAQITRKYGFDIYMDQLIKTTGVSPTSTHCMAFHRDAFVLVTRPLPEPPKDAGAVSSIIEIDGISVRITRSYSQKDGGVIWTLDCLYGVAGMRDDTHGIEVLT